MNRRRAALLLIAPFSSLAQQQRKQPGLLVEVVEARSERTQGKIVLDGVIRNVGTRSLSKLILLFDLLDADRKTISRRRGSIDQARFEPGDESEFHFFVADHARAVECSIHAEHAGGNEVDVLKPGPYPIN
ncbi:MAG: hypothetical protein EHM65_09935 [Acidobacteriales bacterium]|nr:MAG: hypothetical protein EHM65_09935 [Terriglobales bacterium]